MQPSQWEVVILKPTPVFLSFLASQLPNAELPDLRLLRTDNTAYVIRKQECDEATLDEIERNFSLMFRHEISRWLGKDARNEMEDSFLDFLCCFKFEMHSQMLLMEPSIHDGQQLLCIKPRSVLLKWVKSSVEDQSDITSVLDQVNLSNIVENATVLIKNFKQLSDIKPFIQSNYRKIFEMEMSRMCDVPDQWPEMNDFETFNRYFSVEIHTQLIHLH